MAGTSAYGESPYGGELPPWRGIVEATATATAPEGGISDGGSTAQSSPATTADGAVSAHGLSTTQSTGSNTAPGDVYAHGVGLIGAATAATAGGALAAHPIGVTSATLASSQINATAMSANGIAVSRPNATVSGNVLGYGNPRVESGFGIRASAYTEIVASKDEAPPIFEPESLGLAPLANSWEADILERELKEMFMALFEANLRSDERYINVLGVPHLGPRELIEASLAADGLSIYRGSTVGANAGAYLLRAWRAYNPKRGLLLLKTYLQLLWPNVWTAEQMWQEKVEDYPDGLVKKAEIPTGDEDEYFLTSRVQVSLPARSTSGADLNSISSGLRAATPARFVLTLSIITDEAYELGIAVAGHRGVVGQSFEGTMQ